MTVRVQLFARARDLAQSDILTVDLSEPVTVGQLRRRLPEACPALAGFLNRCAVAVDQNFAGDEVRIPANAQVAVIPPVSGG
jgi:molybdopterin converting factor small subunit